MKLNIIILILLYGILYNNYFFCCDLKASSDSSKSKLETTGAHLEKMRTWIERLTEESKKDLSPDKKTKLILIQSNLQAILEAIRKDQSDAASGAHAKPKRKPSKKAK